jgi:hypothetical protein
MADGLKVHFMSNHISVEKADMFFAKGTASEGAVDILSRNDAAQIVLDHLDEHGALIFDIGE